VNNIHERQLTTLRYQLPAAVMFFLTGLAVAAIGFTGFSAGIHGAK